MSESFFRALLRCFAASIVALVTSAALTHFGYTWPSIVLAFGAIVPLAYYHLSYLRPRIARGLTSAAVDSVYYYGFLVTVAALAISAIEVGMTGGQAVAPVLYKFGVGLLATGYAVIARIDLTSISVASNDVSPEAAMNIYATRSRELLDNVETAVLRVSEFSRTVMSETTIVTDAARADAEKRLLDITRIFEIEMRTTLASARDGIREVREAVSDLSFNAERDELTKSIAATTGAARELTKALSDLGLKTREGANATLEIAVAAESLDEAVRKVHVSFGQLGDSDGSLSRAVSAIQIAVDVLAEGASGASLSVRAMEAIALDVGDTGATFKSMRTVAKKATEQLEQLAEIAERFDATLVGLNSTSAASGMLARELANVSSSLPPLAQQATTLTRHLDGLKASFTSSALALEADVVRSSRASDLLTASLTAVAQTIIDRTRQHSDGRA
jgi:hypothetical protein